MKCALHNLGCKVNSYETDAMKQLLIDNNYTIVEFGEEIADVYIINTCTVTNMADRKSRQMLHKAKKDNPDAVVVACGCYAQEAGEKLLEDDAIDIVVGNNKKGNIVQILQDYFDKHTAADIIDINHTKEYERLSIVKSFEHTRAYIKIQDGCNQFCSYCAIPFARGRVRSRSIEDITKEVTALADNGCKEIVVTGIHLSSYGLDFDNTEYNSMPVPNARRLLDAIKAVSEIPGIERVRLGSLEPRIVTEEFVSELAANDKVCPHFHLSLQSGCDATLKRMNRRYDTAEFLEGVKRLRSAYDRPAITTDVIVGFPGETDEEFEETRKYLDMIAFFEMHVFKYSRRKGTVADKMPNQVPDPVKSARSDVLIDMDKVHTGNFLNSFIGQTEEVLVEEFIEFKGEQVAVGHTKRYVKVYITDPVKNQIKENDTVSVMVNALADAEAVYASISCKN